MNQQPSTTPSGGGPTWIGVTATSCLVLAVGTGWALHQLRVVTFDGLLEYIRDARTLREGGLSAYQHAVHPFGYPTLLALVRAATPSLFAASRVVSWWSGIAALALYALVIRAAFGASEARWAAPAALIGSALVAHTLEPSSTLPAATLQLASIWLFLSGQDRVARLAGAGAVVGLAWLLRYPSLLVFGATALWLMAANRRSPRRLGILLAAYALPFFAVASPQIVLNLKHGLDPLIANNAGYILRAQRGHFAANQTIASMLLLEGRRAAAFWASNLADFVLFNSPLLAAMALVLKRDRSARVTYLATVIAVQQLILPLTNFNPKFYLLDRWLMLGFVVRALRDAAPALGDAWSRRATANGSRWLRITAAGLLAALAAPLATAYLAFRIAEVWSMLGDDEVGAAHQEITAALYDRGYRGPGEILGCSNVHYDLHALADDRVVYYREAARQLPSIPRFSNGDTLARFLREHGFRFVLYDDEDRGPCPDLGFLFEPEALPDTLTPVVIDDFYNQTDRLALYQLAPEPPAPLAASERVGRWLAVRKPSLKGLLDDWARGLADAAASANEDGER